MIDGSTRNLLGFVKTVRTSADAAVGVVTEGVNVETVVAGSEALDFSLHSHGPISLLSEVNSTLHILKSLENNDCLCHFAMFYEQWFD